MIYAELLKKFFQLAVDELVTVIENDGVRHAATAHYVLPNKALYLLRHNIL